MGAFRNVAPALGRWWPPGGVLVTEVDGQSVNR
jgi:hypothetical protein